MPSSGSIFINNSEMPDRNAFCNVVGTTAPILYKFFRVDYTVTSVTNNAGNIRFVIGGNVTSIFTAGKQFTLTFKKADAIIPVVVTVTSSAFGANTTIDTSTPFANIIGTPTMNCGCNDNSLLNFYVELEIYDTVTNLLLFSALRITPPTLTAVSDFGYINIDVSRIVDAFLSIDNTYDYTTPVYEAVDPKIYKQFYVKFRSVWTGGSSAQTTLSTMIVAIKGGIQLGSSAEGNIQNTGNFYFNYNFGITSNAAWLTNFTRPKMFVGFPFTMSIYIGQLGNIALGIINMKTFDVTGTLTQNISINMNSMVINAVNRVDPQKIYLTQVGVPMPNTVKSFTLQLNYNSGAAVSQIITVDVLNPNDTQNIMLLYWRNTLGGDAFYGFHFNQEMQYYYQAGTKNKRFNIFAENLSSDEWDGIQEMCTLGTIYKPPFLELLTSTNKFQQRIGQQVYLLDSSGNKTGVIVIPTEGVTETKRRGHRLVLTIELPETLSPL